MKMRRTAVALATVSLLVLAACGSDADTKTAPTAKPSSETAAATVAETTAGSGSATVASDVESTDAGGQTSSPATASADVDLADSLVVVNTGGDWGECQRKSFADPFTAAHGVEVIDAPFSDDAQLKAAVETKVFDADVIYPSPSLALDTLGEQYLEPIDYSQVDKTQLVPGTYTDYAIALDLFSWAFGYRTDTGAAAPTTWEDFYDTTKFPGKRGLVSWDYSTVMIGALLADGVAPEDLIPIDVDRALKKLNTIKDDIVWFDTGSAGQDLLSSGEVSYIQLYANRITSLRSSGDPVEVVWDGQILQADYLGIPKGSPNVATAQAFIAFVTSKDVNGDFSYCQPGAPSNSESTVNPAIVDELPTSHLDQRHVVSSAPEIAGWFEDNLDSVTEKFSAFQAG